MYSVEYFAAFKNNEVENKIKNMEKNKRHNKRQKINKNNEVDLYVLLYNKLQSNGTVNGTVFTIWYTQKRLHILYLQVCMQMHRKVLEEHIINCGYFCEGYLVA